MDKVDEDWYDNDSIDCSETYLIDWSRNKSDWGYVRNYKNYTREYDGFGNLVLPIFITENEVENAPI